MQADELTVQVVRSLEGVVELKGDFARLQAVTGNTLPFELFEWQLTWCRHFRRQDPAVVDEPMFYVAREREGNCVAIVPLIRTRRRVGMLKIVSLGLLGADPAITEIRTGAVSAVATRLLAREDASKLAIIGSGVQARSHLAAIACVRKLKRARVASRSLENARKFADEMQTKHAFPIEPVATAEEAIRGADVIVTATTSHEPVLNREWISPGAHINAVGTYSFAAREVDTATMVAAKLFVDRRESALNEAGDYLIAAREGAIGPEHIRAEIGELLIGSASGRTTRDQITLFKSLGLAIEDLASADYLYQKARQSNSGTWVDF